MRNWDFRCILLAGCSRHLQPGYLPRQMAGHVTDDTYAAYLAAREKFAADVVERWHTEQVQLVSYNTLLFRRRFEAS